MSVAHFLQSDPDANPQFRRRWTEDDLAPPEPPRERTAEELFGEIAMALLRQRRPNHECGN